MNQDEQIYLASIARHFGAFVYLTKSALDGKVQALYQAYPNSIKAPCDECHMEHTHPVEAEPDKPKRYDA